MTEGSIGIGDPAPDFDLPTAGGGSARLDRLRGRKVVLYFYPKADTSGCTTEAKAFQAALPDIEAGGAVVIGVSKDPVRKLEAFAAKAGLDFPLASDETGGVVEAYGAWVEKSMYGRSYMGIDRSTFVLDETGRIAAAWRRVKVPGHVAEVLAALSAADADQAAPSDGKASRPVAPKRRRAQ